MSERLTKQALKVELTRRIECFKNTFGFTEAANSPDEMSPTMLIAYGRFLAAYEMRDQIEKGLFVGGYTR